MLPQTIAQRVVHARQRHVNGVQAPSQGGRKLVPPLTLTVAGLNELPGVGAEPPETVPQSVRKVGVGPAIEVSPMLLQGIEGIGRQRPWGSIAVTQCHECLEAGRGAHPRTKVIGVDDLITLIDRGNRYFLKNILGKVFVSNHRADRSHQFAPMFQEQLHNNVLGKRHRLTDFSPVPPQNQCLNCTKAQLLYTKVPKKPKIGHPVPPK